MKFTVQKQEPKDGEVVIEVTIPFEAQTAQLDAAATRLSEKSPIKGFRPGKATREIVEKSYGGDAILNEALEKLIGKSLYEAVQQEDIKSIGQPKIDIVKQAYGNELVYKATVSLLPDVTVGDVAKVKVKEQKVEVTDDEVQKTLDHFRNMRATEKLVDRAAKKGDMAEIDFATTVDKVAIEGGDAKGYKLVLGDGHMIPGFEEQVEGMKKGDSKTFTLNFPKEYKKELAGKEAEFAVTVKNVYEREMPEVDDEMAKGFGQENVDALKQALKDNIKMEKEQQENQRKEVDMLKQLVEASTFSPIPKTLIDNELHRMQHELEEDLSKNGLQYDQYLQNLGKTDEELKKEMAPQAEVRVKTALLMREIANTQKLQATKEEIDQEIAKIKAQYQNNPEIIERVDSPEYRDYLETITANQKAVNWVKQQVFGDAEKKEEKKEE